MRGVARSRGRVCLAAGLATGYRSSSGFADEVRWGGLDEPQQGVQSQVELPWEQQDWGGMGAEDEETNVWRTFSKRIVVEGSKWTDRRCCVWRWFQW